jgi:uncharacterized protein YfbU (UPF0304 family)
MALSKELEDKLVEEYRQRLRKTLNEGYGKTLWDLEDEVQEIKDEMGQELMEAKLKLKKK